MEAPHRVIDGMLDKVASGATGLVNSVGGTIRSTGAQITDALDKPFEMVGIQGPHHMVDRALNGMGGAITDFVDNGVIGSARAAGKGVMSALDHPIEQLSGVGAMKFKFRK